MPKQALQATSTSFWGENSTREKAKRLTTNYTAQTKDKNSNHPEQNIKVFQTRQSKRSALLDRSPNTKSNQYTYSQRYVTRGPGRIILASQL